MSERKEIVKELDSLFDIELTCNYCGDDRHWADIIADYILSEKAKSYYDGIIDTVEKILNSQTFTESNFPMARKDVLLFYLRGLKQFAEQAKESEVYGWDFLKT